MLMKTLFGGTPTKKLHIIPMATSVFLAFALPFTVLAANESDITSAAQERSEITAQSDLRAYWPKGPVNYAKSAVVLEAETGTVLYEKNMDEKMYPASTTKLMTCLIAVEHSSMDEQVVFSHTAVDAVPADGSSMGIDAGEILPMEECLYGIMVASANEVTNAVAEHVAGSMDAFVELMNEKAIELGCTNTHFVNTNGLHDENHYTTAHDLSIIGRAFFQNDILRRIGNTGRYHFEATETQPDDFYKTNKHQLISGEIKYDGILGGKTGYTSNAGQTLVTGCEQNGMRLITVVMYEDNPYQFTDTVALFDYGYQNFSKVGIAQNDTRYVQDFSKIFSDSSFPLHTESLLSLKEDEYLILPGLTEFNKLSTTLTYTENSEIADEIGEIIYSYNGTKVGLGHVLFTGESTAYYPFESNGDTAPSGLPENVIYINIKSVLIWVFGVSVLLICGHFLSIMIIGRKDVQNIRRRKKEERRNAVHRARAARHSYRQLKPRVKKPPKQRRRHSRRNRY